jgi:hypothetical protein
MAKPNNNKNYNKKPASKFAAARKPLERTPSKPVSKTAMRNSAIPKIAAVAASPKVKKEITHELISRRAYEISMSGTGGSEFENWIRAERELRGL